MPKEQAPTPVETEELEIIRGHRQIDHAEIVYMPHRLALWPSSGPALPTLAGTVLFNEYIKTFLRGLHADVHEALQMRLPGLDQDETPEAYAQDKDQAEQLLMAVSELADEPLRSSTLRECARDLLRLMGQIKIDNLEQLARFATVLSRRLSILERTLKEHASAAERASGLFNAADYLSEELQALGIVQATWSQLIFTHTVLTFRADLGRDTQVEGRLDISVSEIKELPDPSTAHYGNKQQTVPWQHRALRGVKDENDTSA